MVSKPNSAENLGSSYQWILIWFGRLMAIGSVLNLLRYGFEFGFDATFETFLEYYKWLSGLLFDWMEQPLIRFLEQLQYVFRVPSLSLQEHWKDVFVIMAVYFGARLRSIWITGPEMTWRVRAPMALLGLVLSLIAAVAAGLVLVVNVPPTTANLVALYPLLATFVFDVAENTISASLRRELIEQVAGRHLTHQGAFFFLFSRVVGRYTFALLFLSIWTFFTSYVDVPSPGIVALGLMLLITMVYWFDQGRRTVAHRRQPGERWLQTFFRLGSTRVATEIALITAAVLVIIATNAGLHHWGM